jgi:Na+/melibiose symporter-like transporter
MTRMAHNDAERMKLTARTAQFEQVGNITFSLICLPLVALLGRGSEARGFQLVAIIFAAASLICYLRRRTPAKTTIFITMRKIVPRPNPPRIP